MTRYFTSEHEWIDVDGDIATVGITDYAQSQLGDVVFVEVPDVGKSFGKGPNPLAKPTGPSAEEELAEAIKRQHAAEAGSAQAAGPERSRP